MADTTVGLRIQSQGGEQVAKSVGSIKTELKNAQQEALNLARSFGEMSPQAVEAAKKVALLRDEIGDANARIKLFDPGAKFQAFAGVLNTVAGGFTALTGAASLLGLEGEDLQKTLVKVQSALALTQGLNAIADAGDSFKNLGLILKGGFTNALQTVKGAFVGLRGAIIATGLGALAVGIGLLIANFDKVKQAVLNMFPGLAKLGQIFGDLITKVTDFIGVTSEADRALESFTKTNARANEAINNRIKLLQAQGGKEAEIYQLQKQRVENELAALREAAKVKKQLTEEEEKTFRDLKNEILVLEATETRRLNDIAKERAEKQRAANEKAREERLKEQEKIKAETQKRTEDFAKQQADNAAGAREILAGINKQSKDDALDFSKTVQDQKKADAEADKARMDEQLRQGLEHDQARIASDKALADAKVANMQIVSGALGTLADVVGRQTAAGKALAIAQATIDGFLAVQKALASAPPPFNFVAAAAVGIATIANIKKIISTKIPGQSGGGGSVPSFAPTSAPPIPQAQRSTTQLDSASLNQIGNATARAFVLESDVSSSQERIRRVNRAARLS